jgi:hypothetical protein
MRKTTKNKTTTTQKTQVKRKVAQFITPDIEVAKTTPTVIQKIKTTVKKMFDVKWLNKAAKKGFRTLDNVNRAIIPAHVTRMAESIMKLGILRPVVVAYLDFKGVKDYYIIDGQHLYHALIRLGYDIPYVIIDVKNDEELIESLALLNNSSKSWTMTDYVQVWSFTTGDYKTLVKYFNTYDLELCTLAGILHGRTENISKTVKRGLFKVNNEEKAVKLMDYTTDILKVLPRQDRTTNRRLVNSYIMFVYDNYNNYDHKKFIAYLKKNIARLEFLNSSEDDLNAFYSKGI